LSAQQKICQVKITEIKSVLDSLGAAPRKSLGQNLLHDKNVARWIVEKLEIRSQDHVVEIGPGLGALTQEITSCGVSTTLLEKDRAFAKYLREKFGGTRVEVIEGDALDYDTRGISPPTGQSDRESTLLPVISSAFSFYGGPLPVRAHGFYLAEGDGGSFKRESGEQGIRKFKPRHSEAVARDPFENLASFRVSPGTSGRFCCSLAQAAGARGA
jgi:hypothetical protein